MVVATCAPALHAQYSTTAVGPNQIEILLYNGTDTALAIPSTLNGGQVVSIANGAFSYASTLTGVTIPSGVTSIGSSAFYGCRNLTSVSIPASVTTIGIDPFGACNVLTALTVAGGNSAYVSSAGVLFNAGQTTLVQCPGGKTGSYILPTTVTTIANYAFDGCTKLTGVTLPTALTTIGPFAFQNCIGFTTVALPGNITSIGDQAFSSCSGLTAFTTAQSTSPFFAVISGCLYDQQGLAQYPVGNPATSFTIPAGTTQITNYAFAGCAALTSLTLPASVTTIQDYAFFYCNHLTSATFLGNAPASTGAGIFYDTATNFTVYYGGSATGFSSPTWRDSGGDTYPAVDLQAAQTITFPAIATQSYPGSSLTLNATASSGLAVSYAIVSGSATLSGNVLAFTGTGSVTITASQAGTSAFQAAPAVSQTFTVSAPMTYASWESQTNYFSAADLNDPTISGPTATPQHDGTPNALKYFYDIDPANPMSATDRTALPTAGNKTSSGTTYLTLTWRQNALLENVSNVVQTSTDLQSWSTPSNLTTSSIGADPATGDPIMQAQVPVSGAVQFIRLSVTPPTP